MESKLIVKAMNFCNNFDIIYIAIAYQLGCYLAL